MNLTSYVDENIMRNMRYKELVNLCSTSRHYSAICKDDEFWKNRMQEMFGVDADNFRDDIEYAIEDLQDTEMENSADYSGIIAALGRVSSLSNMQLYGWLEKAHDAIDRNTNSEGNIKIAKYDFVPYVSLRNISDPAQAVYIFASIFHVDIEDMAKTNRYYNTQNGESQLDFTERLITVLNDAIWMSARLHNKVIDAANKMRRYNNEYDLRYIFNDYFIKYGAWWYLRQRHNHEVGMRAREWFMNLINGEGELWSGMAREALADVINQGDLDLVTQIVTGYNIMTWNGSSHKSLQLAAAIIRAFAAQDDYVGLYNILSKPNPLQFTHHPMRMVYGRFIPLSEPEAVDVVVTQIRGETDPSFLYNFLRTFVDDKGADAIAASATLDDEDFYRMISGVGAQTLRDAIRTIRSSLARNPDVYRGEDVEDKIDILSDRIEELSG